MVSLFRTKPIAAACGAALLLGSIAGCTELPTPAPAPAAAATTKSILSTPAVAPPCQRQLTVQDITTSDLADRIQEQVKPDQCIAPRQFVMLGNPAEIEGVIGDLATEFKPHRLKRILLRDPASRSCPPGLYLPRYAGSHANIVLELYQVEPGHSAQEAVRRARKAAEDRGYTLDVDFNYLIGDPGTQLRGSPWIPGGSPAEGGAAPAPAGVFGGQMAFGAIGLATLPTSGGKDVRVGVFDSSPKDFAVPLGQTNVVTFSTSTPSVDQRQVQMCVTALHPSVRLASRSNQANGDHGLFVANLVQAVAPEAQIHLYQVLNESGEGDLFTLMEAFKDFICSGNAEQPAVANLSLGLHWYPGGPVSGACGEWDPDLMKIESFNQLLDAANELGVVVVAAAGNNANNAAGAKENADFPAGADPGLGLSASTPWEYKVIGVASANRAGQLSCFSNQGIITAPGGDGWNTVQQKCDPPFLKCLQNDTCGDYGLVSLATGSDTGYQYWAGTSFATPLVSGLAAACLDANRQAPAAWTGGEVGQKVWMAISDGAEGTPPVVNVPNTLDRCKASQ